MIPSSLANDYRIATSKEIRSWSFGALTASRRASDAVEVHVPGTLDDQRIFGPVQDFKCACGKYVSDEFKGMICDRCGVKIAPAAVRAVRFGHIEFPFVIEHPFTTECELRCFPVLPAAFVQSPAGQQMALLYDRLIESTMLRDLTRIRDVVASIFDYLTPVVATAHNWRLVDRETLARGLALVCTNAADDQGELCIQCGYPVAGLRTSTCPSCGARII